MGPLICAFLYNATGKMRSAFFYLISVGAIGWWLAYTTDLEEGSDCCRRKGVQAKMEAIKAKFGVSREQIKTGTKSFLSVNSSRQSSNRSSNRSSNKSSNAFSKINSQSSYASSTQESDASVVESSMSTVESSMSTVESTMSTAESTMSTVESTMSTVESTVEIDDTVESTVEIDDEEETEKLIEQAQNLNANTRKMTFSSKRKLSAVKPAA